MFGIGNAKGAEQLKGLKFPSTETNSAGSKKPEAVSLNVVIEDEKRIPNEVDMKKAFADIFPRKQLFDEILNSLPKRSSSTKKVIAKQVVDWINEDLCVEFAKVYIDRKVEVSSAEELEQILRGTIANEQTEISPELIEDENAGINSVYALKPEEKISIVQVLRNFAQAEDLNKSEKPNLVVSEKEKVEEEKDIIDKDKEIIPAAHVADAIKLQQEATKTEAEKKTSQKELKQLNEIRAEVAILMREALIKRVITERILNVNAKPPMNEELSYSASVLTEEFIADESTLAEIKKAKKLGTEWKTAENVKLLQRICEKANVHKLFFRAFAHNEIGKEIAKAKKEAAQNGTVIKDKNLEKQLTESFLSELPMLSKAQGRFLELRKTKKSERIDPEDKKEISRLAHEHIENAGIDYAEIENQFEAAIAKIDEVTAEEFEAYKNSAEVILQESVIENFEEYTEMYADHEDAVDAFEPQLQKIWRKNKEIFEIINTKYKDSKLVVFEGKTYVINNAEISPQENMTGADAETESENKPERTGKNLENPEVLKVVVDMARSFQTKLDAAMEEEESWKKRRPEHQKNFLEGELVAFLDELFEKESLTERGNHDKFIEIIKKELAK